MTSRMRLEIGEQPAVWRDTIQTLLPAAPEVSRVTAGRRHIVFFARGSSDTAAVYGRYLCEIYAGRVGAMGAPSVATVYRRRLDLSDAVAVGLSQSGRTDEIVQTMRWAAGCGARTIAITNDASSPLSGTVDLALVTRAGRELAIPATKTYSTALIALVVLAVGLRGGDREMESALAGLPAQAEATLGLSERCQEMARQLAAAQRLVVTGRGFTYSTALEVALKIKETCYVAAEALAAGDLAHGPVAVLDRHTPLVIAAPPTGPVLSALHALAEQARTAGAPVYALGGDARLAGLAQLALPPAPPIGPGQGEILAPITLVILGQLVVEALATQLGLDPDSPRQLTKVTQLGSPTEEDHVRPSA